MLYKSNIIRAYQNVSQITLIFCFSLEAVQLQGTDKSFNRELLCGIKNEGSLTACLVLVFRKCFKHINLSEFCTKDQIAAMIEMDIGLPGYTHRGSSNVNRRVEYLLKLIFNYNLEIINIGC